MNRITTAISRGPWSWLLSLVLLVLLLVGSGCDRENDDDQDVTMPQFSLPAAQDDGTMINSDDFRGKTLLINFFATWCAPCRIEVSHLITLQDKYAEQNFSVIGLSVDHGNLEVVRGYMRELGINYPVAMADRDILIRFGNVFSMPTTFLIDDDGKIIRRFDGFVEIDTLEGELQAIL